MANEPEPMDLFFSSMIQRYLDNPRFVRREWLAAEITQHFADSLHPFVLLTAEPGFGKSAFLAQLADDHPNWLRYFIRRDQRTVLADVSARSFLLRLGYQLAARYPEIFEHDTLQATVEQQVGAVKKGGLLVGAEIDRLTVSPFSSNVLKIQQKIDTVSGEVRGLHVHELIEDLRQIDTADLLHMALLAPAQRLQQLQPTAQIIILVDALDEVRYHDMPDTLLAWLANCPELPPNIHFLLTARPPDGAVQHFQMKQHARTLHLVLDDPHNLQMRRQVEQDITRYVKGLFDEPALQTMLEAGQGDEYADFERKAITKADGNIGYLDALARGLDSALALNDLAALRALLTLENLPDHIVGLYAFFLRQIEQRVGQQTVAVEDLETGGVTKENAWLVLYYPLLATLSVAREPLSLQQLQMLLNVEVEWQELTAAIERLTPFLDQRAQRYRFYHATLPEFLTSPETQASPTTQMLYVNATRRHRHIGHRYWQRYASDWVQCDDYGLNHMAAHLAAGGQTTRLCQLINENFRSARLAQHGTPVAFAADVELALAALRSEPQANLVEWVRLCAIFTLGIRAASPLIIDVLARTGDVHRAIWMAANITFAVDRCRAYTLLANYFAEQATQETELSDAHNDAIQLAQEAERAIIAINESHRTMAYCWLVQTWLLLGDRGRATELLRASERVAFAPQEVMPDEWDLPNVLFWVAKAAKLLHDEPLRRRIRETVYLHEMMPLRNMVLQTMSEAGDLVGLCRVARERLNDSASSVRLANIALALAHAGLHGRCNEILHAIDIGSPDHGGEDTDKRHVWARALCGRFAEALQWAATIANPEQQLIAMSRIVQRLHERQAHAPGDTRTEAATACHLADAAKLVTALTESDDWRVQTRAAHALLYAGEPTQARRLAETVIQNDVPTTISNTLTFRHRKAATVITPQPAAQAVTFSEPLQQPGEPAVRPIVIINPSTAVKVDGRPLQTRDDPTPDQQLAEQITEQIERGEWENAERDLFGIQTPALRAQTLLTMARRTADQRAALAYWLRALDVARFAGRETFQATVADGQPLIGDTQQWVAIQETLANVANWR